MGEKLTSEQTAALKDAFSLFDKDGDGVITANELGVVLRSLGHSPSDAEVADIINEVDADDSGTVDFDEFLIMMAHRMTIVDHDSEAREAFKVFDRNGDGYISKNELREVLMSIGDKISEEDANVMIKDVDADGNGMIDFTEFRKLMKASST